MYENDVKIMAVGRNQSPAVLFLNSNKSENTLRKIIEEIQVQCFSNGIDLQNECIVNKGPNRDIDREAINELLSRLITRKYEIVVVRHMKDITNDLSDLKEFIKDVAAIKIGFFELSTMQFHYNTYLDDNCEKEKIVWDGGAGC